MPDSEAKKAWMKENSRYFAIKVMRRTEDDLLKFLERQGKPATAIKKAIREYIANHPEE